MPAQPEGAPPKRTRTLTARYQSTWLAGALLVLGCLAGCSTEAADRAATTPAEPSQASNNSATRAVATFAGGCFWCMEPPYDKLDGVLSTTSGYIGGTVKNPSYRQVSAGGTGHTEAVQIEYDPTRVSYARLLEVFWRNIDPLTANAQFCDHGSQYRSGIFYHDANQQKLAAASKLEVQNQLPGNVVTEITAASMFYPAEGYHQDYYLKNPVRYKLYRYNCGRDRRLKAVWGSIPSEQPAG